MKLFKLQYRYFVLSLKKYIGMLKENITRNYHSKNVIGYDDLSYN